MKGIILKRDSVDMIRNLFKAVDGRVLIKTPDHTFVSQRSQALNQRAATLG